MKENGIIIKHCPEGYIPIAEMARRLGVKYDKVANVIRSRYCDKNIHVEVYGHTYVHVELFTEFFMNREARNIPHNTPVVIRFTNGRERLFPTMNAAAVHLGGRNWRNVVTIISNSIKGRYTRSKYLKSVREIRLA